MTQSGMKPGFCSFKKALLQRQLWSQVKVGTHSDSAHVTLEQGSCRPLSVSVDEVMSWVLAWSYEGSDGKSVTHRKWSPVLLLTTLTSPTRNCPCWEATFKGGHKGINSWVTTEWFALLSMVKGVIWAATGSQGSLHSLAVPSRVPVPLKGQIVVYAYIYKG
jgi:hypothetical protein